MSGRTQKLEMRGRPVAGPAGFGYHPPREHPGNREDLEG
jgi:hypothetical protein